MRNSATRGFLAHGDDAATLTGLLSLSELHSGDMLAGRFRIDALLGIGGFGFVYRAHDLSLDIDVALKLLRPELARRPEAFERFRQELLLARQVSSTHVVRIHDIAQDGGRWFISMDLVDGESLEQRLGRTGKLPPDEAIAITRGVLEGLEAAHQRDVVHRDLKPANILIDGAERSLITDFGVARSLGASGMTGSGMLVGTPEYLSPEQARGDRVDGRSDLYAVGLMLFEMLCGEPPFSGGTPAETVMQRIVSAPPSLAHARPDLPHWLHAFSDRLLQINPAHRFASARDARVALDTRQVPRAPLRWRRFVPALLLVAVLGSLVAALGFSPAWRSFTTTTLGAAVPRVAWLPLRAPADDVALAALARALDEHAQAWLRGDAAHSAVPRRRVLDALARQTPGLSAEALARQLPEIAAASGAASVMYGELRRDGAGLLLQVDLWLPSSDVAPRQIRVQGVDANDLYTRYLAALPTLFGAATLHPGPAPVLAPAALPTLGQGLLQLDRDDAAGASAALAGAAAADPASAIARANLLQAQQNTHEELSVQTARDDIVQRFAADHSAPGRELYARALLGNDRGEQAGAALTEALHDYPNDAALTLLDVQTLIDAGNGAAALAMLRHYVTVDDQDARAWYLLGRTAIQQGEADAAVSNYLTRALVLNRLRADRAAEAETSNALGVGYERLGQLDAAAESYTRAAAIRERLDDSAGLAKSLRNLAIVQAVQGDSAAADRTLDRVKLLLEKNNDRASLADLYNDRGVVAEEHGACADALVFYRKALALRQELNLTAQVADSLNNVGFCSYSLGDFDNALVFWQQAQAQYQKVDDRNGTLRIDESIGLLDIARGHFAQARERLAAALQAAEDHQLPEEAAVAHTYLGQLALLEGRYADAAGAARRAAETFLRRDDRRGEAEAALLQANIALVLGDASGAEKILAALPAARLNAEQHAMLLLASAQRASLAGDADDALKKLEAAGATIDSHSSVGVHVQLERIRAALARNDTAAAAALVQQLRGETVRLGEVPVRLEWLELEIAVALRSGDGGAAAARYREALAVLRTTGRWAGAIALHRLGALALASVPAETQAARSAADALQAQVLADTPEALRASLRNALARRWQSESGTSHGQ